MFEEDQWEEVLHTVQQCSINTAQHLSQLFIVLRVHFTPARLYKMGIREDSDCPQCSKDHELRRCPKLHLYWKGVVATINRVFQINIPLDPKLCILCILDDLPVEDDPKQAITRALFQARKLILRGWKVTEPPTLKEWVTQMGATLRLEK